MKTLLALIFTLSAFSVIAFESESNCAQISDAPDRTTTEVVSSSTETSTTSGSASVK